jgi:hypothetical protein
MLAPVRQLYPTRLEPDDVQAFVLETNLPVAPILQPKIFFKNTSSSQQMVVKIEHVLDLGVSDDPLLAGSYATTIVNDVVGPGDLLWHVFAATFLGDGIVYHRVTVSAPGTSSDIILEMWVEGVFEESLKVLPAFEPIVL